MSQVLKRVAVEIDGKIDGLQQKLGTAGRDLSAFADRVDGIGGGSAGQFLSVLGQRISGLGTIAGSGAVGLGVLATALTGLAVEAVRSSDQVDTSLKRIRRSLDLGPDALDGLRGITRELASYGGRGRTETASLLAQVTADGPGSVEGLKAITRAAVDLSDALGGDAGSLASGLDGVLDGFGIASERAGEVAAQLYAVSRGKVPMDALLETLGKLAPVVQEAGLSLQDVTGYVVGLLDRNWSGKKVVAELERIAHAGAEGARDMKRFAGEVPATETALRELSGAAQETRDSLSGTASAIKNELLGALTDMGAGEAGQQALGFLREFRSLIQGLTQDDAQKLQQFFEGSGKRLQDAATARLRSGDVTAPFGYGVGRVLSGVGSALRPRDPREVEAERQARLGAIDREVTVLERSLQTTDPRSYDAGIHRAAIRRLKEERAELERERDALVKSASATAAAKAAATAAAQKPLQNPAEQAEAGRVGAIRTAITESKLPVAALQKYREELKKLADESNNPKLTASARDLARDIDKQITAASDAATRASERAERASERLKDAQASARQAFDSATAAQTPGGADNLEEVIRQRVAQAREAEISAEEIAQRVERLRAAAAARVRAAGEAFNESLREQLVRGTRSAVDDAQRALDTFLEDIDTKRVEGLDVDMDVAKRVAAQKQEIVEITKAAEELEQQLARLQVRTDNGGGIIQEARELNALLDAAQAEANDAAQSDEKRAAAAARVAQIQARIVQLQQKGAENSAAAAAAESELEASVGRVAKRLQSWANLTAAIVSAFAGANGEVTQLVTGIATAAGGLSDLMVSAKSAGGLGNLLKGVGKDGKKLGGSEMLAAAGSLGGIISGGTAIVGALGALFNRNREPTAAERADLAAREANTRAIQELTSTLGDSEIGNTAQRRGRTLGVAADVVGSQRNLLEEFDRQERERQEADPQSYVPRDPPYVDRGRLLENALRRAGISFEEFEQQAKALGVTVTRTGEGVEALLTAADSAGVAFGKLEDDLEVFGRGAGDRLRGVLEIYAGLPDGLADGARATARALRDEYDLTSKAGRDAAIRFVREQYRLGLITADTARQLITGITGLGDEIAAAAEEAAAAIDAAFTKLAAQLRKIDLDRELLGLSPEAVIRETIAAYRELLPAAFRDLFDGLLEGVDLGTAEGRARAKERAREIYREMLADGVLDDTEAQIADGLVAIIGSIDEFGDGLQAEADRLAEIARRRPVERAGQQSQLLDEGPVETFARRARAYAAVFPEIAHLLDGLDLTTAAGVAEADKRLREFFGTVGEGEQFDPLRSALLDLEAGADAAAAGISAAAAAIMDATSFLSEVRKDNKRLGRSPADAARYEGAVFNDSGRTLSNGRRFIDEFGQYDFADPTQRRTALDIAQARYPTLTGLDREFVGQWIDWLQEFGDAAQTASAIGSIRPLTAEDVAGRSDASTSGTEGITRQDGSRIQEYTASIAVTSRRTADGIDALVALFSTSLSVAQRPLVEPPAIPGFGSPAAGASAARSGNAVASVVVHVHRVSIELPNATTAEAVRAGVDAGGVVLGQGVGRALDQVLGGEQRYTNLVLGDLTVVVN